MAHITFFKEISFVFLLFVIKVHVISFIQSVYIYKKEGRKGYCEVISKAIHLNHFKSGSQAGVNQFLLLSKNDSSEIDFSPDQLS